MSKTIKDTIKKTTDGQSNKLGKGGRFKQLENKGLSPKLAAWIGDKKYGKHKMSKWSADEHEKKV